MNSLTSAIIFTIQLLHPTSMPASHQGYWIFKSAAQTLVRHIPRPPRQIDEDVFLRCA